MNPRLTFSNFQLAVLIMGFLFGDTILVNPSKQAKQDTWIAYLLGWVMGIILISLFVKIAKYHPGKTLIGILRATFGKLIGNLLGLLYIWFFLQIPAMILRNAGEFMINTSYTNTPMVFLIASFTLVQIYALKKGLDIASRASEILIYMFFLTFFLQTAFLIPSVQIKYIYPIMDMNFMTILVNAYRLAIFPFGEMIVFLMIVPSLEKKQQDLTKVVILSVLTAGSVFVIQTLRDLTILGPEIFSNTIFPAELSAKLIPHFTLDPLISSSLSLGSLMKSGVFVYASIVAIAELFNVKHDNRIFVIPVNLVVLALSLWLSKDLFEQFAWIDKVWPYYAVPYEILVPFLIFAITWFKSWVGKKS